MASLRRWSFVALVVGAVAGTSACEEELTGPTPGLSEPSGGGTVDPGIICRTQHPEGGTELAISGESLAPIPFDIPNEPTVGLPDVTLSQSSSLDGGAADGHTVQYGGDPGQTNASLLGWSDQNNMSMTVTDDVGLEPGIYDLTVTNANEESATSNGALAVTDRPAPSAITPGLVCLAEADRALTIAGDSFVRIGDGEPVVRIGNEDPLPVDGLGDCAAIAHDGIDAEVCGSIDLTVPQDYIDPGSYSIVVRNPETAACESLHDEDGVELVVVGPPVIETAEPPTACSASTEPVDVTFSGTDFINADGETFEVTLNGEVVTPVSVDGCEPIEVDGLDAESCTSFTVTVDPSATPEGRVEIGVTNPESVGCGHSTDMLFTVLGPPTVTAVEPDFICSEQTETITVTGENFADSATVRIGMTQADSVDVQSDTTLVATFGEGFPAGTFDVTVDNGAGCSGTLTAAVDVLQSPIVFFVDPPVIYNDVAFEITIFTSGLDVDAAALELVDADGNATMLSGFQSPTRPNRILATVPAGLDAGEYDVQVTDQEGCPSAFDGSLTITDDLTLNLAGVDPEFASATEDTAVTISSNAPPAFVSTPRAYLNPNPAAAGATATALEATVFVGDDTMTAVVPGGLATGSYDLIVVNPSGEVGVLSQGIMVTDADLPVIDTVTPATFANNTDYDAEIRGSNFDAAGVTVSLDCEAPDGTRTEYTTTVQNASADTITATLPTSQLSKGTICLVIVANDADGTSFKFSAISITNSAFNLEPWTAAPSMTTARRALSLEAGRPTRTSRFIYAIGGDTGTTSGALDSVEASSVDVFGEPGAWREHRNALPEPRTLAGAERIGRFLYLVGGSDGSTPVDTVWRASVLDPLDAPEITDVDAQLGDGSGLSEGLWMYRVAAVYPASKVDNPLGESLPGEVQNVDLPAHPDLIQLTITWESVPDAVGYRIYRSPSADASVDELALVAEIGDQATTSWTDDGAMADMTQPPLPPGSTGTWHPAESLNTAREAHALISVPVPGTTDQWALYAMGGRDGTGALDTVEYTTVTVAPDGSQTMAPWTTATETLATPLAETKAFRVKGSDAAAIPDGVDWLYVGPGRDGGNFVVDLQAFEVTAGLEPSFFTVNRTPSSRAGYCAGASNAFLYVFGGASGGASSGGISAELCESTAQNCGDNVPPDLAQGAWNSLGISMSDSRVFCDVAQESAFYFVAGGSDGANALSSVDTTVQ